MFNSKDNKFDNKPLIDLDRLWLKKNDDMSIITEPNFSIPSKRKVRPSKDQDINIVHVSELHSLFNNPKQFMWLFRVDLEYHLLLKSYVTWPYIIAIVLKDRRRWSRVE